MLSQSKQKEVTSFIRRNYKRWKIRFPDIEGVHIGLKETNEQLTQQVAVVFHIKTPKGKRTKKATIPTSLRFKNKKGKYEQIITDVIATGKTQIQFGPGSPVCNTATRKTKGSIGPIVKSASGESFLLSNMHVFGRTALVTRRSVYRLPRSSKNIAIIEANGTLAEVAYFHSGCVNDKIDAAIALVDEAALPYVSNLINGNSLITTPGILPANISPTNSVNVKLACAIPPFVRQGRIDYVGVTKTFPYPAFDNTFHSLIRITPRITNGGDSGSTIYNATSNEILGIVLGADDNFTYGIPIADILFHFDLQIS